MKKIAKLSLVAAVAVAGFSTTATAGALEDAIKNTSILGYASYRYDDRNRDNNTGSNDFTANNHKIALGLVSKITEDLTYTYVGAVGVFGDDTSSGTGVDYMGGKMFSVYSNFTYTGLANTSIIVGQQGLNTPQTDVYDDISGTQEGTGVAVVSAFGPVTLVGGYMNQTNINVAAANVDENTDLAILQAMAKVGPVALDATYLDFKDAADTYSIGAKGSVELGGVKLSPYARYTALSVDNGTDQALWFVGSKANLGAFGLNASYTATEKDGGLVAVDADAEAVNQGWALNLLDAKKGHQTNLNASYAINSAYTAAISHNMRDQAGDKDNETYGQLTWKPAKNFYAYIRYGVVDYDGETEGQRGRLHMTYTF